MAVTVETCERKFQIPQQNLKWLEAQVSKLAKRSYKLGLTPFKLKVGPAYKVQTPTGGINLYHEVEIEGQAPVLPGWGLVGIINIIEGQGILKLLPDVILPEVIRNANPAMCDHCNTQRVRNDTFLLQSEDGRTLKQVGRTCLKDFLPGRHVSPEALAWAANSLSVLAGAAHKATAISMDSQKHYVDLLGFLTDVAAVMRLHGWVSRKDAYEKGGVATADLAWNQAEFGNIQECDFEKAQAAATWAERLSDLDVTGNDFLESLRTLAHLGVVDPRTYRVAGAMLVSHAKWLRDHSPSDGFKLPSQRQFIGAIGNREKFPATLTKEPRKCYGKFGEFFVHEFNSNGDRVVLMSPKPLALTPGTPVTVEAKIKAHEVFNGGAQTLISHPKIL